MGDGHRDNKGLKLKYTCKCNVLYNVHNSVAPKKAFFFFIQKILSFLNPCPAEPRYTLPLQTVKKPTDLDLHCLPFSM